MEERICRKAKCRKEKWGMSGTKTEPNYSTIILHNLHTSNAISANIRTVRN